MAAVNRAYAEGDETRLRQILEAWEHSPESVEGKGLRQSWCESSVRQRKCKSDCRPLKLRYTSCRPVHSISERHRPTKQNRQAEIYS